MQTLGFEHSRRFGYGQPFLGGRYACSSDEHHKHCVQQLRTLKGTLLTCWPVLTEVAWLLRAHPLAIGALLTSFTSGPFRLAGLHEGDLPGITVIMRRYRDLKIQLADAALLHLANREGIETVFTVDRRDFGVLRLARNRRLRIVPNSASDKPCNMLPAAALGICNTSDAPLRNSTDRA